MKALNYYKHCNEPLPYLPLTTYTKDEIVLQYRGVTVVKKYVQVAGVYTYLYICQCVIVNELTGVSKTRVNEFLDGVVTNTGQHYHHHKRPQLALKEGLLLLSSNQNHYNYQPS